MTQEELVKSRARLTNHERNIEKLNMSRLQLAKQMTEYDRRLTEMRASLLNQRPDPRYRQMRQQVIDERMAVQDKLLAIKSQIAQQACEKEAIKETLLGTSEDPRITTASGKTRAARLEEHRDRESLKELKDLLMQADELLWGEIQKGVVFKDKEKATIQHIHQRCRGLQKE